jgi:hypothetical protein
VLEPADAAVDRAELPEPPHLGCAELSAEEHLHEEEAQKDAVRDGDGALERIGHQPILEAPNASGDLVEGLAAAV